MNTDSVNHFSSSVENLNFLKSLRQLTASIDEGIVITDEKQKIIWVNKAFEDICGVKLENIKGKNPNVLQGIDTNKNTVRKIGESLDKGKAVEAEILNYKPDKTPYWIKLNISPLINDKDGLTNFVGFEHDITDAKEGERNLAESENIYKDLFALNPCVMWICDISDFSFIEVNRAAVDKYGYSREEFLKMSLNDIKSPEDRKKLENTFSDENETYRDRGVMKHIKKNGEEIFVDLKTNRIQYAGKPAHLHC